MKKLRLSKSSNNYPWFEFYKDVPLHIDYPKGSMVDVIVQTAFKYPDNNALVYYNNKITYRELVDKIIECAKALRYLGIKKGDIVSICMPNTPTALYMFYAVNMVGAVANMIHPLSSEKEIELYLNKTESKAILTIDINYKKVINIINNTHVTKQELLLVHLASEFERHMQCLPYMTFHLLIL